MYQMHGFVSEAWNLLETHQLTSSVVSESWK